MGGILLLAAMIAIYIIIYWSIAIETYGDKNFGILGFKDGNDGSTHKLKKTKNTYLPNKEPEETFIRQKPTHIPYKRTQKKTVSYAQKAAVPKSAHKKSPYLKQKT